MAFALKGPPVKPRQAAAKHHMLYASEEALWDAASGGKDPERRIARDLVTSERLQTVWRPHQSRILEAVASGRFTRDRALRLRREAAAARHSRMLIDHIRVNRFDGDGRARLFTQFFPNLDTQTAILREHRRYTIAVSDSITLERLLGMHDDTLGLDLLQRYSRAYAVYFKLYCQWLPLPQSAYAEVMRLAMIEARNDAEALRHQLLKIRRRSNGRGPNSRIRRLG